MVSELETSRKLLDSSASEINAIKGGHFSDHTIMLALYKISDQNGEPHDKEKELALLKLIWRSPEVEEYYAYDQILFNLMDEVIELENGKGFLDWGLTQVILDAHLGYGFFAFDTYWNYARGFLYQGQGDLFARFIGNLLTKTLLPDYALRELIMDSARLGASHLAHELQTLGEKRYAEQWQTVPIEELLPQESAIEAGPKPTLEGQADILKVLSTQSLADIGQDIELESLLTPDDTLKQCTKDIQRETLLLRAPDIIWFIFKHWEEDLEGCLKHIETLKALRKALPALALLGDLLSDDAKEAFIFEDFGKTAGFTFNSVTSYVVNSEYNIFLRANAANALMQIPSKVPRYRSQVIKILKELLIKEETDPEDDEILCSFLAADLLGTDLYELKPAITQAFREDRVDPRAVGLGSFSGKWSLPSLNPPPPSDEQSIFLKCEACGRTRSYAYRAVFLDINSRGRNPNFTPQEFFLDHSITCPKCGAEEAYSVGFQTMVKFIHPGFFTEEGQKAINFLDDSVYLLFSERLFYEGLTPGLISTLRKKIMVGGLEALNDLEWGEYARVIGNFQESLSALRKFHAEHPDSQSGALALALAEHDYGDRDQAKTYYQRSLALNKGNALSSLENPPYTAALRGLKALEQGERSPYLYPINKRHQNLLDQALKEGRKRKRH